ncbi:uncharacterized membrane protein YttA-like [Mercenaria mercenaria]|uniref:uncharacterized membrane protein YttA-like n=1 Tax=Mercenaria mercenaria TaxID=6596 RepID=UPI00234E813C|nr:uncharacterized membrane protein YttA-like [Mercenaria mercenaria]
MSGKESKRSGRSVVRHDYNKVNSEGFVGIEELEDPAEYQTSHETGGEDVSEMVSHVSASRTSTSEETLASLESEYKSLVKEEEELQREAQISKLKKKIARKQKSVAELRGEPVKKVNDSKITLQNLRKKKKLRAKAQKELKSYGLASESETDSDLESSSDSTESGNNLKTSKSAEDENSKKKNSKTVDTDSGSDSESSSDSDSSVSHKKKSRKYKKKSGISAKSSDHVKFRQKYPQAYLRYEHVSAKVSFDSLEFNFICGWGIGNHFSVYNQKEGKRSKIRTFETFNVFKQLIRFSNY